MRPAGLIKAAWVDDGMQLPGLTLVPLLERYRFGFGRHLSPMITETA